MNNKKLRNFIRTQVTSNKAKIIDDYLFNIYDTRVVIKILKNKIDKHSKGTNSTRYIPSWEDHIKFLESLKV